MSVRSRLGKAVAPRLAGAAPQVTDGFVREALRRAISGVGPLPGAAQAAENALQEAGGKVDRAIRDLIEKHVRYAGAQGFATNLGGVMTLAVAVPANIAGLALIQCRLIAGIAHLRGYDLDDPRVRNAVLVALLGEDSVDDLVERKKLPAPPMALATAPLHDADLDRVVSSEVAAELLTRVAGKRMATVVGRRVPFVGGIVGMGADGFATWRAGRYADRELLPRSPRATAR